MLLTTNPVMKSIVGNANTPTVKTKVSKATVIARYFSYETGQNRCAANMYATVRNMYEAAVDQLAAIMPHFGTKIIFNPIFSSAASHEKRAK